MRHMEMSQFSPCNLDIESQYCNAIMYIFTQMEPHYVQWHLVTYVCMCAWVCCLNVLGLEIHLTQETIIYYLEYMNIP